MNPENSQSVSEATPSAPSANVPPAAPDVVVSSSTPPPMKNDAQPAVPEPVLNWMQQTLQSMTKPGMTSSPASDVPADSSVSNPTPPAQVEGSALPTQPLQPEPTASSPSQPDAQSSSAAVPPKIADAAANTSKTLPTPKEPQVPVPQQPVENQTSSVAPNAEAAATAAPRDPPAAVLSTQSATPDPPKVPTTASNPVLQAAPETPTLPSVQDKPSAPRTASFAQPTAAHTVAPPTSVTEVPQSVVTPPASSSATTQAQPDEASASAAAEPAAPFSFLRQIFERPMPGALRSPVPVASDNVHPILRPVPKHAQQIIESFRTTHISTNAAAHASATMPDFSGLAPRGAELKTEFDAYLQNEVFDESHPYADTLLMLDKKGMHEFVRSFTPKPVFVDHKVHEPSIGTLTRVWVENRPDDTYLRGRIKFDVSTERGRRVVETIHAIGGTDLSLGGIHEFRNGRRVNTHIHEISVVGTGKYLGSFLRTAASAGGGGTPASGILVQLCSIDIPAPGLHKRARINRL